MKLEEVLEYTQALMGVGYSCLDTNEQIDEFCKTNCFHAHQHHFSQKHILLIKNSMNKSEVHFSVDCFRIRVVYLYIEDKFYALGPYRCEMITENEAEYLLKKINLPKDSAKELRLYRSPYPIKKEEEIINIVQNLIKFVERKDSVRKIVHFDEMDSNLENRKEELTVNRPAIKLI